MKVPKAGPQAARRTLFTGAGMLAAALLLLAPAFACTPSAQISAEPARAEAGTVVQISGNTFDPQGSPVSIRWGGASGQEIASATVNASGAFAVDVRIPDADPGWYQISGVHRDSTDRWWVANLAFQVQGSTQPGREAPPSGAEPRSEPQPEPRPAPQAEAQPEPEPQPEPQAEGQPQPGDQPQQAPAPASEPEPAPAPEPVGQEGTGGATAPAPAPVGAQPAAEPVAQQADADDTSGTTQAAPSPAQVGERSFAPPVDPAVPVPFQQFAAAPTTEGEPVAPPVAQPGSSSGADDTPTGPVAVDVGPNPWLAVPLVLLGIGLFTVGAAHFVHDVRQQRTEKVEG